MCLVISACSRSLSQFDGKIEQMRLNPTNVQNVVIYNVVIDVGNPEQKLKPGMTANLTITIDERNNVLKVPNSALRFTPQDASGQRVSVNPGGTNNGAGNGSGQGRRQSANAQPKSDNANGSSSPSSSGQANPQQGTPHVCAGQRAGVGRSDQNSLGPWR